MKILIDHARKLGPLAAGTYRVVVLEADDRLSAKDFEDLAEAARYADDAASEYGDVSPIAVVVNDRFQVEHRGKPYYAS